MYDVTFGSFVSLDVIIPIPNVVTPIVPNTLHVFDKPWLAVIISI